jgi:Chaperone of endosialidase
MVVGSGAGTGIGTAGSGNTILGDLAATSGGTADNNIYIGANVNFGGGPLFESGAIRIGDSMPYAAPGTSEVFIAGIFGADVTAGQPTVKCNANGQLGTVSSSARFKKDIASMGKTSEAIFSLRPVTFHYKNDPTNIPAFGLIAEEVAKVIPDLVIRDRERKVYSVRYDDVNVMLLNEFLKEHKKVEEQQASIAELKSTVAQQQTSFQSKIAEQEKQITTLVATVREQAAQIQRVSAQVEMAKPASRVVANKP